MLRGIFFVVVVIIAVKMEVRIVYLQGNTACWQLGTHGMNTVKTQSITADIEVFFDSYKYISISALLNIRMYNLS